MQGDLPSDSVLPWMLARRRSGERVALVTVAGVDGGSPRGIGAQMAVSDTGEYVGYLSGGCLEEAVAQQAVLSIAEGKNCLVRYGRGSSFIDVRLPCGSGIDVYIDQSIDDVALNRLCAVQSARNIVVMRTNLSTGCSDVIELSEPVECAPESSRFGDALIRVHVPPLRLFVIGIGPIIASMARIGMASGLEVYVASPNEKTRHEVALSSIDVFSMSRPQLPEQIALDRFTAVVLAFHEHDWEPRLLQALLRRPSFYVGAVGSSAVHQARIDALRRLGVSHDDALRVRGPIGMIAGAKSSNSLAVGAIAEIFSEAKERRFVA